MLRAALYCRLSREDERKVLESESIQNQRGLLLEYAAGQGWTVVEIYIDEDYSGVDQSRPAFNRMLGDARKRRFDVLLCKSQSRFSRDIEQVEQVLHRYFPEWGIRFIALTDGVDTGIQGGKKSRQINALVNEWYLEDLSDSIRAALDHKRRQGQYIGSFAAYGYQKDAQDRHRLVIDPEPAAVVRRIFGLYLSGLGKLAIAKQLNAEGIPNPTETKRRQGEAYINGGERAGAGLWNRTTVGRILHNRLYVGDLVQGRRKKLSYKSKRLVCQPPAEWMISPGTHPPVIDVETYEAVQRILASRVRSDGSGAVFSLSGLVFCGVCGGRLSRVTGSGYAYLRCAVHANAPQRCSGASIRLESLETLLAERLRGWFAPFTSPEALSQLLEKLPPPPACPDTDREEQSLLREIRRRKTALRTLYLDKASGDLDAAQYGEYSQVYQAELEALTVKLTRLRKGQRPGGQSQEDRVEMVTKLLTPESLSRTLACLFIRRVVVNPKEGSKQAIQVTWRF